MDGVKTRSAANEYRPVDVDEFKAAEQEIITHVQKEAFKKEISKLKKVTIDYEAHKEDDSRSRIQKPKGATLLSRLDPFLDHSNLVGIGGRIKQATSRKGTSTSMPFAVSYAGVVPCVRCSATVAQISLEPEENFCKR